VGADPTAILEAWLPEVFSSTSQKWEYISPALRLSLSGQGGGDWELRVEDGQLTVERVRRTLGARPADLADLLFAQAQDMDLLEKLDGRIKFELEGRRRRRWSVDAAFGPAGMRAGQPRTTVSIDSGTCEKLAARVLTPLQALLAGRLHVDGDRVLAMQVLMLVATRMGG
jgi:hypothetical protein